ncbi:MAG: enoyl-CoA hydratase/isomerase family protein [Desulfobacteraceae bacterium]|jgi:enoyl-CoA hydratase/carnithine racemase|nr:enoyl-CoA hydratase/isomerase family protein [Desulfobacteraceae bacterium]
MPPNNEPLIYRQEGEIAFIEIDRPEKKNALNYACWQLLDRYCDQLVAENQIRALVITGRPADLFSAGVDVTPTDPFIAGMFEALQNRDRAKLVKGFADMQAVVSKLARLPIPTVAAINGLCYGGAVELAAACDIRVIKEGAVICLQESRLGLIPDFGGTVRLARLIGPARAKELIFTARRILPDEAKELGLVSHIFSEENFIGRVTGYVKSITANGPKALAVVKEICDTTFTMAENQALEFENEKAAENVLSGQCIEGIGAFLEKRAPKWKS